MLAFIKRGWATVERMFQAEKSRHKGIE